MRRRLAGSVLIFEAIVIILAIPVAINVAGVAPAPAISAGLALATAAVVVAARVDRPGGVIAGWIVQALVLASALIIPVMALLGGIFAALWFGALRLVENLEQEAPAAPAAAVDPASPDAPAPSDAAAPSDDDAAPDERKGTL
jgi:H+/gluconate symporter-like permease